MDRFYPAQIEMTANGFKVVAISWRLARLIHQKSLRDEWINSYLRVSINLCDSLNGFLIGPTGLILAIRKYGKKKKEQ